jgi:hypothetical protein
MTDAYVLSMPYSLSINSHILSSFLRSSLSIHQQHHCHSSTYCPFFAILITTDTNSLSGTIPTEIVQLAELRSLSLRKYDGCLRSLHALFFIYKLTYFVLFSPLIALNSPTTPLSFIAILSIFCDSYYDRGEPAYWDHSYGNRTIDSTCYSISM